MSVFKPNKYFSRETVISSLRISEEVSVSEVVTWVTSYSHPANENVEKNITLEATSSLGGTITYSIIGGADQALFSLADVTLTLAAKNFESPVDFDGNNAYEVTIRATSSLGATADINIVVGVADANEANTLSLTGTNVGGSDPNYTLFDYNDVYGVADAISFASDPTIQLAGPDASLECSLTISVDNGTCSISPTGLTFSVGDGNTDTTMTFTGTVSNINSALSTFSISSAVTQVTFSLDDGAFSDSLIITVDHINSAVEQQTVTFDSVPDAGVWKLGISAGAGDNYEFAYNDSASTIQAQLRGLSNVTDIWGSSLTVTGNYTIGFTVTAAKYGNLDTLYSDVSALFGLDSISSYAVGTSSYVGEGVAWDNSLEAAESPNSSGATTILPSGSSSAKLLAQFGTNFVNYPNDTVPTNIIVTVYTLNDTVIKDNIVSLTAGGTNYAKSAENFWTGANSPRVYNNGTWGVSLTGGQWASLFQTDNSLEFYFSGNNTDVAYDNTGKVDAIHLSVTFPIPVGITHSTITNG